MSYIFSLIQDKGKWKEFAVYSLDADGAFNDCEDVIRVNTERETVEDAWEKKRKEHEIYLNKLACYEV